MLKRVAIVIILLLTRVLFVYSEENYKNNLIDLNLPSGTQWLNHNLGANNTYDFGDYYLGGDNSIVKSMFGEGFNIPTREQFQELYDNTQQSWTEVNGVKGMSFKAANGNSIFLPAGAHLWWNQEDVDGFWDINNMGCGAYWTSTPSDEDYYYFAEFDHEEDAPFFGDRDITRNKLSVRPVYYCPVTCKVYSSPDSVYIGQTANGFCADGLSEIKISYKSSNKILDNVVDLNFSVNNESASQDICGVLKKIEYYNDSINIIIQAPVDFKLEGSSYDVELAIRPYSKGEKITAVTYKYRVFRPGVLFFHGLGSNSALFDEMCKTLINNKTYEPVQLLSVDYSESNTSSFESNTKVRHIVKKGRHALQDSLFNKYKIICSRFDIIGHSMGGILSRLYVQEDDGGISTNKIITLNTPHFGSEFGNVAVWADSINENIKKIQNPNNSEKAFSFICEELFNNLFKEDKSFDALKDLSISSDAIEELNGASSELICGIPVHALCSTLLDDDKRNLKLPTPFILPQLMMGLAKETAINVIGDGIVPLYSQQGGLSNNSTIYSGDKIKAFHCYTPQWNNYINRVELLLKSSRNSELFSLQGFGKTMDKDPVQFKLKQSKGVFDYTETFVPVDSSKTSFKLSAKADSSEKKEIKLEIHQSDDVVYSFVVAFTNDNGILYEINSLTPYFDLSGVEYDELTFYALGKTDYNAIVIDSISLDKDFNISSIKSIGDDKSDIAICIEDHSVILKALEECEDFEYSIYNSSGQIVAEGHSTGSVTLSNINKGLYIISVTIDGSLKRYKIAI